jgi:hypothetical protein
LSAGEDSWLNSVGEEGLNMGTLYQSHDIYGNSILSWLSGGINVHVDIAKDPFVTSLNINKYTYNIAIFMLRAGFGKNALWFLNQPVIKELSRRQNLITGEYLKKSNKNLFDARKDVMDEYKEELLNAIPKEVLDRRIQLPPDLGFFIEKVTLRNFIIPSEYQSLRSRINKAAKENGIEFPEFSISEVVDNLYNRSLIYKYRDDLVQKDK